MWREALKRSRFQEGKSDQGGGYELRPDKGAGHMGMDLEEISEMRSAELLTD